MVDLVDFSKYQKKEPIFKPSIEKAINIIPPKKIVVITAKKDTKPKFNKSIELNLIKSIYSNRFGSTTNKILAHMKSKIINAWRSEK